MTQYFYEGGRLLFPALAFAWLSVDGRCGGLDRRGAG